ncbi:MAG: STAS domain-containing protein [Rhodospirillaceae bacterium]|nr:STAS domain-containing protein [Rhodospirillaceae bacterium]
MEIAAERQDRVLSVHVSGRIDAGNASEFEKTVRSAIEDGDRTVIVNFENLRFISSTGLRVVLMTAKSLRRRDAAFALCSLSGAVLEVFRTSGFDKIIAIHPTRADALASLER